MCKEIYKDDGVRKVNMDVLFKDDTKIELLVYM